MSIRELSDENILQNLKKGTSFVVFYADWCPHCKHYLGSGVIEQLQDNFPDVNFFKFEASTIPEHAQIAGTLFKDNNGQNIPINAFPTFVLTKYKNKQLFHEILPNDVGRDLESQSEAIKNFEKSIQ